MNLVNVLVIIFWMISYLRCCFLNHSLSVAEWYCCPVWVLNLTCWLFFSLRTNGSLLCLTHSSFWSF